MRDELSSIATHGRQYFRLVSATVPSFKLRTSQASDNQKYDVGRLCKSTPCVLCDQYPQRLPPCKAKQLLSIVLSLAMDPREIIFGHKSPVGVREKH